MLRIYHVTGTRGMRVIWLCEELGLPYEVTKIDFSATYRSSAEWRKISPVGKVPAMMDNNKVILESGAMVQYIMDTYSDGQLKPPTDHPDYGLYLQWLWFAEATLARPLGEIVNHGREFPDDKRIPTVVDEMTNRAAACLQAVSDHMQNRTYLAAEQFSAADIMMGYAIMLGEVLIPDRMPAQLQPYWQRLQARPTLQKARSI